MRVKCVQKIFLHSTSENIVGGNFARTLNACTPIRTHTGEAGELVQLEVRKCLCTNAVEDGNVCRTKENVSERERSMLQQVFSNLVNVHGVELKNHF